MNERWIEIRKGADFAKIGETFSIDPVIARLIRNRDVTEMDEIRSYLYGGTEGLHDPRTMRDMEKAVSIITDKIKQGKQIRINVHIAKRTAACGRVCQCKNTGSHEGRIWDQ